MTGREAAHGRDLGADRLADGVHAGAGVEGVYDRFRQAGVGPDELAAGRLLALAGGQQHALVFGCHGDSMSRCRGVTVSGCDDELDDDELGNVTADPSDVAYECGWHDGVDYGYRLAVAELEALAHADA